MKKITTDLPFRYRLDLKIVKRRGAQHEAENLLPDLKAIKNSRSGNKISRFFRHIFEHKNIRRVLGSNIAMAIIATSIIPSVEATNSFGVSEEAVVRAGEVIIKTEGYIQYPTENTQINQGYSFFHSGIDLEGITGEPVKPVMAGEVEMVQYSNFGYGNAILIRHGDNFKSLYAHLSKIDVKKGDKVDLATIIGKVGSTGRSSGDHLHLEIYEAGRQISPFSMLPKR